MGSADSVQIDPASLKSLDAGPLGLIAGNGVFPLEFAKNARAAGRELVVVAHRGETNPQIEEFALHTTWIAVGQLGKLLKTFTRAGVRQVAFAGGIKKAKLFKGFSPDLCGILFLAKLRSSNDDVLLRGVTHELEVRGIKVFSASLFLQESVAQGGCLTRRMLSATERSDAAVGWEAAKGIGALDIGQTVVVKRRTVVAVEAVDGTDATIARGGSIAGPGAVVVKVAKPQQDLRVDLPTIGVETIRALHAAEVTALVIEAGKTLLLDPVNIVKEADQFGIVLFAAHSGTELRGET